MAKDRRGAARRTTRLRPAKLVSEGGRFLFDCALVERSADGARVRAFGPVDRLLPEELFLFDEVDARKWRARIVWARGAEMGLALASCALAVEGREHDRIAGRYYAVPG